MSSYTRITGLSSGMDTEALIGKMMKAENTRVDKIKQKRQYEIWRQDSYRDISGLLIGLKSNYMDVLKPEKNLRSPMNFNVYTPSAKINGVDTNKVNVNVVGSNSSNPVEINSISQLAKANTWKASNRAQEMKTKALTDDDFTNLSTAITNGNTKLKFKIDNVEREITLVDNFSTEATDSEKAQALATQINDKLNAVYGSGTGTVTKNADNSLNFNFNGHSVSFVAQTFTPAGDPENPVAGLGSFLEFGANATNVFDSYAKLNTKGFPNAPEGATPEQVEAAKNLKVSINGYSGFGIQNTDSIAQAISKINGSSAGVKILYDDITGKYQMQATKTGHVNNITIGSGADDQTAQFLGLLGLSQNDSANIAGQDAKLKINGTDITSATNTIYTNGLEINLNNTHEGVDPIKLNFTQDTKAVVDKVKEFVTKYNETLDAMRTATREKRDPKFPPLTEEQKKEMKEEDIKAWEQKAKAGLLRSDSDLEAIMNNMRAAFNSKVDGLDKSFDDIGLRFTSNYKDGGKIELDELKFRKALQDSPDDVTKMFTSTSSVGYGELNASGNVDQDKAKVRFSQNGLMNRLLDVVEDATRSSSIGGSRGTLVDKAGIKDTLSQGQNEISKKIENYDKAIDKMIEFLAKKQESYYQKFGRLEVMLAKAQQQQTKFSSMLGTGGQ